MAQTRVSSTQRRPAKASTKRQPKQQPAWVRDMVWQQYWSQVEG